jgi:hypothetical protein
MPDFPKPPPMREIRNGWGIYTERFVEIDDGNKPARPRGSILGFLRSLFH